MRRRGETFGGKHRVKEKRKRVGIPQGGSLSLSTLHRWRNGWIGSVLVSRDKKYLVNSREWAIRWTNREHFGANRQVDYRAVQVVIAATRTKCTSGCWKAIRPIIGPLGGAQASIGLMDSQEGRSIPSYLVYKSHDIVRRSSIS